MTSVQALEHSLEGERILVLGAGGWFGSTMLDLCSGLTDDQVLAIGSRERLHSVCERTWQIHTFDDTRVHAFGPTLVANFAFLTRERVELDGEAAFTQVNTLLTEQFLRSADLPTVKRVLTVSSGAAVTEPASPYGAMKAHEEREALARAGDRTVVVARAYSVSGPFVQRPRAYALSDMVLQAFRGAITITADRPVFRRYVSVHDVLTVCLLQGFAGSTEVIETGGQLVEMGELAHIVRTVVNPSAAVTRPELTTTVPSLYASDDHTWQQACASSGVVAMDLASQIRQVAEFLSE